MTRPVNIFDNRDVRDYNKPSVINSLRNNCVRAVELDDRQGTKKKGTYLLAMKGVADGIYAELGIKGAKGAKLNKVVVEDPEAYKKLVTLLAESKERSEEQETELEELDKEIESLNSTIKESADLLTNATGDVAKLQDKVKSQVDEIIKLTVGANDKPVKTIRKTKKGAK